MIYIGGYKEDCSILRFPQTGRCEYSFYIRIVITFE